MTNVPRITCEFYTLPTIGLFLGSVNHPFDLFQARTNQLLQQNRELLEHIAALGGYEPDRPNLTATSIGIAPQVRFNCGELFLLKPPLPPTLNRVSPLCIRLIAF